METTKRKRPKRCSKENCKAPAKTAGKCLAHYQADYRAGVRLREVEDLGEGAVRREFRLTRGLSERFDAAVPAGQRSAVLRRALEAELQRMSEEKGEVHT